MPLEITRLTVEPNAIEVNELITQTMIYWDN